MIRIEHVTWTYPNADAPSLRDLELHVAAGEFVVLCGASGSGKSTALRLMNGLIPHFHEEGVLQGAVAVAGLTTSAVEPDEIGRRTGTVLQHPRRQFFADTAREELAFAMENFGLPPERIRARVAESAAALAAVLPIEQRLQHLSGGQQQQVAIAASTAHRPAVLLLDEPSSNLSADAVRRLVAALAEHKAQGTTIVVAEHRLRYLEGLLDRVVVMRDGAIDLDVQAQTLRGRLGRNEFDTVLQQVPDPERMRIELELSGFDLREIQDVVHQRHQGGAGRSDPFGIPPGVRRQVRSVLQKPAEADNRRERRADLVDHVGQQPRIRP